MCTFVLAIGKTQYFCRRKVVIKTQNRKKILEMTNFQRFYLNLRVKDAEDVRRQLEQHVSQPSFLNWKRGSFEPDSRWWPVINAVAEKYGYDKPYTL